MPSAFWSKPENRVKKCSERRVDTCDHDATDDCCEVIACTYCLVWQEYGEPDQYGTAVWTGNSWEGSVGPISFRGFWERGYETGECEFVVEANGEEVYRKGCYEGQSCRDSSDETEVSIPYIDGTLSWNKDLKRPLPHVTDYGTTCKRRWCGDCECTCRCLCVTVTDPDGSVSTGMLCDTGYECDGPVWSGTIGGIHIDISLEADEYDNSCFLLIGTDYEEFEHDVTDCTSISFSFEMYDGTLVEGACKTCEECEADEPPVVVCEPCPEGTDYPWLVDVSFPQLDISVQAANQLDEDEDGETTFLYVVEGAYTNAADEESSFQCNFGECEATISINPTAPGGFSCVNSGTTGNGVVSMRAIACPPDQMVLLYEIDCGDGTILEVVITGPAP